MPKEGDLKADVLAAKDIRMRFGEDIGAGIWGASSKQIYGLVGTLLLSAGLTQSKLRITGWGRREQYFRKVSPLRPELTSV